MKKLDIPAKIAQAEHSTGLNDWDGTGFRDELEFLAGDVWASGPSEFGLKTFTERVSRTLTNRLKVAEDRKRYPEIANEKIRAPMVVIGVGRSGSTFMQALLAQDPVARSVAEWEGWRPSPPPQESTYRTDPRIAESEAEQPDDPAWKAKHIYGAELPIECGPAFFNYEFLSMGYDCRWRLPNYRQRLKQPIPEAYRWHKMALQHFQLRTKRDHWVLKSGEHLTYLDELFETYPDVRVVFTHRDPAVTFISQSSVNTFLRAPHYEDEDPAAVAKLVGPEVFDFWGNALEVACAFRAAHPEFEAQFYDVDYRNLIADPMREVQRIYQHFGMELPAEREAAMRAWYANYKQDQYQKTFGAHKYTAEEFGIDTAAINERFRDYKKQFGIKQ